MKSSGGEKFPTEFEKVRTVDSIIVEESIRANLYPQSPEATKKHSFINNPESASKTLKASILSNKVGTSNNGINGQRLNQRASRNLPQILQHSGTTQ